MKNFARMALVSLTLAGCGGKSLAPEAEPTAVSVADAGQGGTAQSSESCVETQAVFAYGVIYDLEMSLAVTGADEVNVVVPGAIVSTELTYIGDYVDVSASATVEVLGPNSDADAGSLLTDASLTFGGTRSSDPNYTSQPQDAFNAASALFSAMTQVSDAVDQNGTDTRTGPRGLVSCSHNVSGPTEEYTCTLKNLRSATLVIMPCGN